MAIFDFPTSPTTGQIYTANGKTWRYDGTSWKAFNVLGISGGGTGKTNIDAADAFLSSNSTGTALTYRSFVAGSGININISPSDVTFTSTGGGGGAGTVNSGEQYEVGYYPQTGAAVTGAGSGLTWNNGLLSIGNTNSADSNVLIVTQNQSYDTISDNSALILRNYNLATLSNFEDGQLWPSLEFQGSYDSGVAFSYSRARVSAVKNYGYPVGLNIDFSLDGGNPQWVNRINLDFGNPEGPSSTAINGSLSFNNIQQQIQVAQTSYPFAVDPSAGLSLLPFNTATGDTHFIWSPSINFSDSKLFGQTASAKLQLVGFSTSLNDSAFVLRVSQAGTSSTVFQGFPTGLLKLPTVISSTGTTSGTLVVAGGVGIGGSLYVGGIGASISGVRILNGVINTGAWAGSTITTRYGGTGIQSPNDGDILAAVGNTWYGLAKGNTGQVLTITASSPYLAWENVAAGAAASSLDVGADNSSNAARYLLFVNSSAGSGLYVSSDAALNYNPFTDILSVSGIAITSSDNSNDLLSGALRVNGGAGISGNVNIGGTASIRSGNELRIYRSANDKYSGFKFIGSIDSMYTLPEYPTGSGVANSVLQSSDTGILSWIPMSASSSGLATTATNVNIESATANASHPLIFTPNRSSSGSALSSNGTLVYNPNTDILSTSGLAVTVSTFSSSTTTGAATITGGLGLAGNAVIGGTVNILSEQPSVGDNLGPIRAALLVSGGIAASDVLVENKVAIGVSWSQTQRAEITTNFIRIYSGQRSGSQISLGQNYNINNLNSTGLYVDYAGNNNTNTRGWGIHSLGSAGETFVLTNSDGVRQVARLTVGSGNSRQADLTIGNAINLITGIAITSILRGVDGTGTDDIAGDFRIIAGRSTGTGTNRGIRLQVATPASSTGSAINPELDVVRIVSIQNSSSTTSGSMLVNGGVGITGNAFIGGTVNITNSSVSTNTTSGALVVSGGVGVGGSLYVGGIGASISGVAILNGVIDTGAWAGTAITTAYGGIGAIPAVAKGDILVGSGNTWYNFPIGSNDFVLTADNTTQFGVKWAAVNAATSALATTAQNINVVSGFANTTYYFPLIGSTSGSGLALTSGFGLSYNPGTTTLYTGTVVANLTGNVTGNVTGNLTGFADTSKNVNIVTSSAAGNHYLISTLNSATASGVALSVNSSMYMTPSTGTLTASAFSGPLTGNVTGNLTGTATTSTNSIVNLSTNNITHYLIFSPSSNGSGIALSASGTGLTYNPALGVVGIAGTVAITQRLTVASNINSTSPSSGTFTVSGGVGITGNAFIGGTITAPLFTGNVSGVAITATNFYGNFIGTATTATNVSVQNSSGTNTDHLVIFVPSQSTSGVALSSDTTFKFNPNTEILSVSGLAVTSSTATGSTLAGAFTVRGGAAVGQSLSVGGRLQLFNGTNYAAFIYTGGGPSTVYTLPVTGPTGTGNSFLVSNNAGVMSWVPQPTGGSATPGGSDTQIQFNDGGSFGGDSGLTFIKLSNQVSIGSSSRVSYYFEREPVLTLYNVDAAAGQGTRWSPALQFRSESVIDNVGVDTYFHTFKVASDGKAGSDVAKSSLRFRYAQLVTAVGEYAEPANSSYKDILLLNNAFGVGIAGTGATNVNFFRTANSQTADRSYILPTDYPATGTSVLQSDSTGNMSWVQMGGGGSGSVNSGIANSAAFYAADGTAVSATPNLTFAGSSVTVIPTTSSTSTSTGALVVRGGLGLAGNAFIGGTVTLTDISDSTSITSGALVVNGGIGVGGTINAEGNINVRDGFELRLHSPSDTGYVGLDYAGSTTKTYVWPTASGTEDGYLYLKGSGSSSNTLTWLAGVGTVLSKSVTIFVPSSGDEVTLFEAYEPLTVVGITGVNRGTGTGLTWTLNYNTDRSSIIGSTIQLGVGGTSHTAGLAATTTGIRYNIANPNITANSFVWLRILQVNGTIPEFNLTVHYRKT